MAMCPLGFLYAWPNLGLGVCIQWSHVFDFKKIMKNWSGSGKWMIKRGYFTCNYFVFKEVRKGLERGRGGTTIISDFIANNHQIQYKVFSLLERSWDGWWSSNEGNWTSPEKNLWRNLWKWQIPPELSWRSFHQVFPLVLTIIINLSPPSPPLQHTHKYPLQPQGALQLLKTLTMLITPPLPPSWTW